jgi:hypothetical protein
MNHAKAETVSFIAKNFCQLFEQQMGAVEGRRFKDFSREELEKYQERKLRLLELRSELDGLYETSEPGANRTCQTSQ